MSEITKKNDQAVNPWKQMVPVFLSKASDGDQNFARVVINGKAYQIPRGKPQKVPRPVYEALSRSEHAKHISEAYNAENAQVERSGS